MQGDPDDFPEALKVRAAAVTFYLALLEAGRPTDASEFAEWYLEMYDHDLET